MDQEINSYNTKSNIELSTYFAVVAAMITL